MKFRIIIGALVAVVSCGAAWLAYFAFNGLSASSPSPSPSPAQAVQQRPGPSGHASVSSAPHRSDGDAGASQPSALQSGEANSLAISDLVARANASEQLTPSDAQTLLAFISSPKPGDLTDGEWEERVNVILNLLRRQTEDFETEDRRQEGAGSLASSLAGRGVTTAATESAVPGLTEVLLEMAEKNPCKVLRLYAMQHLSRWFAEERNTAKRRAMVGLLEKLATRPGDETAGSAVLMLGDMRRQVSSVKFQVSSKDDGAAGEPQGQSKHPSANNSATSAPPRFDSASDGIDWERVDRVLETASRRLIGDARAGADVRISAVHSCVDRKDAGALPDLRRIAADTTVVSTLRKAAIHGIGQLGTAEDMPLLDSLPQDDRNLSQAVVPARKALVSRTAASSVVGP